MLLIAPVITPSPPPSSPARARSPVAWNLIAPSHPKPAETGISPEGQIPLPIARSHPGAAQTAPLPPAPAHPGAAKTAPLPLVEQTQDNQLPGIWMCKDKHGDTVFSNRTEHYRECRPYVLSPGLREAFLREMLLERKQRAPQHVIPDQTDKRIVIGPL